MTSTTSCIAGSRRGGIMYIGACRFGRRVRADVERCSVYSINRITPSNDT